MKSRTLEQEPGLAYIPPYVLSISPRSMMGSSYYSGTLPITSPMEDALVRKVNEMGRQLEALKMKSEGPYKKDFNMAPSFTPEIMDEAILPRFTMP